MKNINVQGISRMMCRHRRKKHLKERMLKVLYFLCFIIVCFLFCGYTCSKPMVAETITYFVETGDSLWSIADENTSEDIDKRDYLDIVYCLNEGLTPDIKCGQAIILPIIKNDNGGC